MSVLMTVCGMAILPICDDTVLVTVYSCMK